MMPLHFEQLTIKVNLHIEYEGSIYYSQTGGGTEHDLVNVKGSKLLDILHINIDKQPTEHNFIEETTSYPLQLFL